MKILRQLNRHSDQQVSVSQPSSPGGLLLLQCPHHQRMVFTNHLLEGVRAEILRLESR